MKFICEQKELHDALKLVGKAMRPQMISVWNNLVFRAQDEALSISGIDGEVYIKTTLTAGVIVPGETTIPVKRLMEIVSALPNDTVQFQVKEETNTVRLACRRSTHQIQGIAIEQHPLKTDPEPLTRSRLFIRENWLQAALRQCIIACSKDETRPVLTGLHLQIQPDRIWDHEKAPVLLVACDTQRLAVRLAPEGAYELKNEQPFSVTVPARAASEMIRFLDPKSDHFAILDTGQNALQIETGKVQFRTVLLEGSYPNFLRIRPPQFTSRWCIGQLELLQVLKRLEPVAREDYGRVYLRNDGREKLILEAREPSGSAYEETDVTADGPALKVCFNLNYLRDAVTEMEGDALWLQFSQANAPVLIRSATDPTYETMLNPMTGDDLTDAED